MRLFIAAALLSLSRSAVIHSGDHGSHLTGQELVDHVNKVQDLFRAKLAPAHHALRKKLMKREYAFPNRSAVFVKEDASEIEIPESFDARTQWPHCPSLTYIRDQANCGSCWAMAAAEVMSDRLCIASRGKIKVTLSAYELLSCCKDCGHGCDGGHAIAAWDYFEAKGVVTGGIYGTTDACKPFGFHPCGHHGNQPYYGECPENATTPQCVESCQPGYPLSFNTDKRYGQSSYFVPSTEAAIQKEILRNGPVAASFVTYEDIEHYENGIYQHTAGKETGSHAVKIIGWGTENGKKYWLIANSWNTDWGENGYFRMIRGVNDCGIEQYVSAGYV